MLSDVASACECCGRSLPPDKTEVMTNAQAGKGEAAHSNIRVKGMQVQLLKRDEAAEYLGRKNSFQDARGVELDSRLQSAWREFFVFEDELINPIYPSAFEVPVIRFRGHPYALYGAAGWILDGRHEATTVEHLTPDAATRIGLWQKEKS